MFNPEANSPHLLSLETAELLRTVSLPDTLGQECAQELISFLSQENRNETVQASSLDSSSDIRDSISNENVACTVSGKLRCSIVGSNVSGTSTHPHLNTDVVVMMPDSMFEETDVLNNVYFEKRKLFVAFLGMTVRKWISSKSEMMLETALFKGDPRKPILVLYLPQKTSSIRIYPSVSQRILIICVFSLVLYQLSPTVHLKMTALRLDKNNVRPHWWNSKSSGKKRKVADNESKEALDPSQLLPTPHYNMAILEDAVLGTVTDMVCKVCSYCPVAKDILILAKVCGCDLVGTW